jgi:hypothetical protein
VDVQGTHGDTLFPVPQVIFSPYLSPLPIRTYVDFHGVGVTHYSRTPRQAPPAGSL